MLGYGLAEWIVEVFVAVVLYAGVAGAARRFFALRFPRPARCANHDERYPYPGCGRCRSYRDRPAWLATWATLWPLTLPALTLWSLVYRGVVQPCYTMYRLTSGQMKRERLERQDA